MKEIAGITAIVLSLVGYVPYIRDVIKGKTKPHVFTWIVWTIITFVIGFAQIAAGAGWSSVHNIVTGFVSLFILYFGFKYSRSTISLSDIFFFIAAIFSIPIWILTKSPVGSIILLSIIDFLAFVPTFRKTWKDPTSETLSSYIIAGSKYIISLFAIAVYSFSTILYPIVLIVLNVIMVLVISKKYTNKVA